LAIKAAHTGIPIPALVVTKGKSMMSDSTDYFRENLPSNLGAMAEKQAGGTSNVR
jgi:hypothetical protein